jgi:hypothetical protein
VIEVGEAGPLAADDADLEVALLPASTAALPTGTQRSVRCSGGAPHHMLSISKSGATFRICGMSF